MGLMGLFLNRDMWMTHVPTCEHICPQACCRGTRPCARVSTHAYVCIVGTNTQDTLSQARLYTVWPCREPSPCSGLLQTGGGGAATCRLPYEVQTSPGNTEAPAFELADQLCRGVPLDGERGLKDVRLHQEAGFV